jgi:hypothetical protein
VIGFRKALAFLAWALAFIGGSTVFSPWCEINDDGFFADVPGLEINLGHHNDDDDD